MATDMLLNSSVETGSTTSGLTTSADNWVGSGNLASGYIISIETDGTAVDGARYQRIRLDTPTAVSKNVGLISDPKVSGITAGNIYTLSAALRAYVQLLGCTAGLTIYWYKSDDTYISISATTLTPIALWRRYSLTAAAPALAAKAAVYVSLQGIDTGDTGWLDFDAVKLEESATPTTYADADEVAAKLADFSTGLASIRLAAKAAEGAYANIQRQYDGPWTRQGTVLSATAAWEIAGGANVCESTVFEDGGVVKMWYHGGNSPYSVGYATAPAFGEPFVKYAGNPILANARYPHMLKVGSGYHLYVNQTGSLNYYTSVDGVTPVLAASNLIPQGPAGSFDSGAVANMHVWNEGSTWFMLYEARKTGENFYTIGLATASAPGGPFVKYAKNPVLGGPTMCASHPHMVKRNGLYHLFFHGGSPGTLPTDAMRATGTTPYAYVVDAWPLLRRATAGEGQETSIGQIADLSVVEDSGTLYMYYTAAADGNAGPWTLDLATAPITEIAAIQTTTDALSLDASGYVTANNAYATAASLASARSAITGTLTTMRSELAGKSLAASLTTVRGELATVDSNVDAILVDTGTTLDTKINTIDTVVDAILVDTGTTLETKINYISANADAILMDTGTSGVVVAAASKSGYALTSAYDAAKTAATATSVANVSASLTTVRSELATVDSIADAILVDTGTTLDGKIDSILEDTATTIPGTIAALKAVADNILRWFTNKRTVTESAQVLYADDDSTPLYTQVLSDDNTTSQRDKAT